MNVQEGLKNKDGCYEYSRKYYFCTNPKTEETYPFIGYGDTTKESPVQIKTRKKWCPLNEKE